MGKKGNFVINQRNTSLLHSWSFRIIDTRHLVSKHGFVRIGGDVHHPSDARVCFCPHATDIKSVSAKAIKYFHLPLLEPRGWLGQRFGQRPREPSSILDRLNPFPYDDVSNDHGPTSYNHLTSQTWWEILQEPTKHFRPWTKWRACTWTTLLRSQFLQTH